MPLPYWSRTNAGNSGSWSYIAIWESPIPRSVGKELLQRGVKDARQAKNLSKKPGLDKSRNTQKGSSDTQLPRGERLTKSRVPRHCHRTAVLNQPSLQIHWVQSGKRWHASNIRMASEPIQCRRGNTKPDLTFFRWACDEARSAKNTTPQSTTGASARKHH